MDSVTCASFAGGCNVVPSQRQSSNCRMPFGMDGPPASSSQANPNQQGSRKMRDAPYECKKDRRTDASCLQCQHRKVECSGTRPTCDLCMERNHKCAWSGPIGQKALMQVRSACKQCHQRKAKCSGERPTCRSCRDRSQKCEWHVEEGVTRMEDLKRKLKLVIERTQTLNRLTDAMRSGSDDESSMLLARLRVGHSIEDIVKSIQVDSSPSSGEGRRPSMTERTISASGSINGKFAD